MARGPIEAVTIDFYNTLVFHRGGQGRGAAIVDYLEVHGLEHAPWEHSVLYEVFEDHERRYPAAAPPEAKAAYHRHLAGRLFDRLQVRVTATELSRHAPSLWRILGPSCFGVFADAFETLGVLRSAGYPIALVSNWQSGVRHFCEELGLLPLVDHVLGSADIGFAKPDPRIFHAASDRLGAPPERVLHVGDSFTDDYDGARAAGFVPVHLVREPGAATDAVRVVRRLSEVPAVVQGISDAAGAVE